MVTSPGRDITAANTSAAAERVVRPVLFVELEIEDGSPTDFVRATNAPFDIAWGGRTFKGVGNFGSVSTVDETSQPEATGVELTLNGIETSLVSIALDRHIQGDRATVFMGFMDDGHVLVDDPFIVFRGRMDVMRITVGESATIRLSVESVFADWDRPRVRRYNNADQQQKFPADKFFEFAEQTVDKDIVWPARNFFNKPQFQ